ncbi:MAG: hypothetical protein JW812_03520 [Alphaproteobacteria bacterium]|nr:hypothetical protein [Alphaproteobacteria bacterium]
MLKRLLSLLFFILLSISSTAFAECTDPAKSLLGLTDIDISRNSLDFNCVEVAFLKRAGLSGFSYNDYLDKFKITHDKAQELSRYGFTPDRDYFLRFLERYSAGSLFQKLKEAHADSFTTLFNTSRNTFVNNGQVCSADLPDFSALPAMAQPAYFIGNTIYDTLSRKLGSVLPSQDGKSTLKVGAIEKEITWHESCYSQDSFTQISATLTSCWLCPLYDYFFKAVSDVTYVVWHKVRKPMISLIAIIFLLWFMIKLIKMFMGQGEELTMSFFTKEIPKKLGMIAIAAFILGTSETGYDLVQDFVNMVLTPLSELSVYISKQFLNAGECSYTPLSFTTTKTMFNPEIKNNILCLVEQLLGVFMDYILLASALLLKSFSFLLDALLNLGLFVVKNIIPPLGAAVSDASPSIDFLKSLAAFFFTTVLAWVFIFSFLRYMFQTLFYMIDPIFNMGMMFLWLPFTFLTWIIPDLSIDASNFKAQFKMLFKGFLLMIFTALIVSICGTILLGLMSSSESYAALQTAIRTNNFSDIWSAIDIDETIILRLIAGLIIIHTMMKKIPEYANTFAYSGQDDKVWNEMKDTFNKNYQKAKKQLLDLKNNISFFKKMKK